MDNITERLAQRLNERGATSACPACGQEDWIHFGGLGNLVVHLTPDTEHRESIETHVVLPAYVLICANCGLIRLHGREVLDEDANDD
jgi:hypothetical protein